MRPLRWSPPTPPPRRWRSIRQPSLPDRRLRILPIPVTRRRRNLLDRRPTNLPNPLDRRLPGSLRHGRLTLLDRRRQSLPGSSNLRSRRPPAGRKLQDPRETVGRRGMPHARGARRGNSPRRNLLHLASRCVYNCIAARGIMEGHPAFAGVFASRGVRRYASRAILRVL